VYNFCIKADQSLAASFEDQIHACNRFLINNIEITDWIDGEYLTEMKGKTIEQYRRLLVMNHKKIVLLDCSLSLDNIEQYNILFRKAHLLGAENIRVELDAENPQGMGYGVLSARLIEILKISQSYKIGIVLENIRSSSFNGDQPIADLLKQTGKVQPGVIFNPLEFAAAKKHPFFHVFYNSRWKSNIKFLRVNDGLFFDGSPSMPGEGNAELKEMTSALLSRSFKGYFSFIPYFEGMNEEYYSKLIERFDTLLLSM
jgi:sugar phosphate isomerase/epimerase